MYSLHEVIKEAGKSNHVLSLVQEYINMEAVGSSHLYSKKFKLKNKQKNGNMGDPAPNDVEIPPVQAGPLPGADEENHPLSIVAQAAMAAQAITVANCQVPSPEKFSFKPEDWTRWIRRFETSRENQVNTLVYCMGEEVDDIMVSFGLNADDAKQYESVKNRFESQFYCQTQHIRER